MEGNKDKKEEWALPRAASPKEVCIESPKLKLNWETCTARIKPTMRRSRERENETKPIKLANW